jgi:RHS repeat-associated protein
VYQQFGYVLVNSTAQAGHQQMYLDITVPTGGYLYTYVANESNVSASSVYYDDFTIVHTRSTPILQVLQTSDYYPFGLQIAAGSYQKQTTLDNDYLYNGKELQDEHNLGWVDYGARMYMPEIGRWGVTDPMSSKRHWLSPYNYVQNSPISRFDPSGMLDDYALDRQTGDIEMIKKTNDKTDKLIDKDTKKVIASKVEKGLLKDGQNIKQNRLQTDKVKGGIELVVKISMHVEQEVTGTVYKDSKGKTYLNVEPYKDAKKVIGKNNEFYMTTGRSSEIKKNFTSGDGTFSGQTVAAFHTHPGWTGFPQFGTPEASDSDDQGIMDNKIHNNLTIPFYIYARQKMTNGIVTSNVSMNQFSNGMIMHTLKPQSYGVELD